MNRIIYQPKAIKQLLKIPERNSIKEKCKVLADFPHCTQIKSLTNHKYQYRLRVGNYRVFFNFDGAIHIISIEEVKKRDDNTYA